MFDTDDGGVILCHTDDGFADSNHYIDGEGYGWDNIGCSRRAGKVDGNRMAWLEVDRRGFLR